MSETALAVHRALYDAVEGGDADLMTALWVDDPDTSCVHPGAPILRGTSDVVRSWVVLMSQIGYIQFFLTDVEVTTLPPGSDTPGTAVVTCTESILSGDPDQPGGILAATSFGAATAQSTSILVRGGNSESGGGWKFWLRHASPVPPPLAAAFDDLEEH